MCAIDDCEPATLWHETEPTARKPHICYECGRAIKPGESYHRVKCLSDGRWWNDCWCNHCDAAGEWLRTVCGGYPISMLHEELVEHWREGYASVAFGRLIVAMQRKWRDGADPVPDVEQVKALAVSMMRKKVFR
jgi:hypothetical protein